MSLIIIAVLLSAGLMLSVRNAVAVLEENCAYVQVAVRCGPNWCLKLVQVCGGPPAQATQTATIQFEQTYAAGNQ